MAAEGSGYVLNWVIIVVGLMKTTRILLGKLISLHRFEPVTPQTEVRNIITWANLLGLSLLVSVVVINAVMYVHCI